MPPPMSIELKVPTVGESITEVQIGQWLKQPGDSVAADEPVVVIETDKVTVELPAPSAGTLAKVLKKTGETARVGEVVGTLEAGPAAPASPPRKSAPAPASQPAAEPAANDKSAKPAASAPSPAKRAAAPRKEPAETPAQARVMPSAARLLAQEGLRAEEVAPSGPGGRLLKEDVQRELAQRTPAARESARESGDGSRQEEVVPMTPLRRKIAERLVAAQHTAAILTTFNEIDMGPVQALRKAHQERFQERHRIKLGMMSFFVKAVIDALKLVPALNAELREGAIVYRNYFDVGIAVGGGKGLVVPVLRNAERASFAELELAVADLGARARDNKLTLEELTGGTFTISNGGIYGSLLSTPILNPPQSGILGLHAIQDRPVAREGAVVIRPMMYVALSYDHRLVDGREAVTFLKRVKECIEEPSRMLLEI
jgi:2-oxoglutarate dehydrogenase E2 component (dihydrolipoamide succinyltransferase)